MTQSIDPFSMEALHELLEELKKENLAENDMLLDNLARSRAKLETNKSKFDEVTYLVLKTEFDNAEIQIYELRHKIIA